MEKIVKTLNKNQKTELRELRKKIKIVKEMKRKYNKNSSSVPKWMDCVWKRIACGKNNCPICGDLNQQGKERVYNAKDVLEDIEKNLKKVLKFIKTDAKKIGIEISKKKRFKNPPRPEKFPLYVKARDFRDSMLHAARSAESGGELWVYTEAFQDLMWYMNLFPIKVYRQLCNKWHIEQGEKRANYDYKYTKYVLGECFKILKNSLSIVMSFDSAEKDILMFNAALLMNLEKDVKKISVSANKV